LAKAIAEGYVYTGQYSRYRQRRHGTPSRDIPASRFVVCTQNHDQVGNRMLGERLSELVSLEGLKLAAGTVLLSPFIPLLFAGEEYGETAPFQYFVSHSDPELIEAVRQGRRCEFASFQWCGEVPDAQAEATFRRSCLGHSLKDRTSHAVLRRFYKELIHLRSALPPLNYLDKEALHVSQRTDPPALCIRRWSEEDEVLAAFHFGDHRSAIECVATPGAWERVLDSAGMEWLGAGSAVPEVLESNGKMRLELAPTSFCLLRRMGEN
jgi:maltooligosyltrehalose trehalohydrolase